jgi:putative ABC transport system ATP-binding protein
MIEVKNLEIYYKDNILNSNINFTANNSEFVGILGKSGSGKSSLLNIIGLLSNNYNGTYMLDDIDVKSLNKKSINNLHQKKIGFLFQNFALIDDKTVKNNLLIVKNIKIDSINKLLNEFNLEHLINRKVYELSGGEQQRVAFIRLLLQDPEVILIDEPGANLDEENKEFLLEKIFSLKNKTVLIVTHDKTIASMCTKVVNL